MKVTRVCVLLCCHFVICTAEWFTAAGIALAGIFVAKPLYCRLKECCKERWIPRNITRLDVQLNEQVFGQHIAVEVVYKAIKGHVLDPNPSKALVLSLHGWTGCGKNHISTIIADSLYKLGGNSKYVHKIIPTKDFPNANKLSYYKDILLKKIIESVKKCSKTMFIFDEVDKAPQGLLNILKPFLDHHQKIDDVDYRKCIFIFLSNTGGNHINNFVINHWKQGKKRENLDVKDMESILNKAVYNIDGGLWHSDLISHNVIDFFVPILPLERRHVKECIKVDLLRKNRNPSEDIVNKIADRLQYGSDMMFSTTGCKRVSTRVDEILYDRKQLAL
ncbi:torsin-1A-like [Xenia sp. Carnegie-2017]|uniref:torsin-1A-like n=1 Tax=Xenia sp. Carnegie-2017 TaxID=2897299 RepID=UPI001F0377E2|nr:torsin-1A-like [Xenia sp. Carnegie-2017]